MPTHETEADAPGSHSHEHAHGIRSLSAKLAAHDHPHAHLEDPIGDNKLNGHTHASARTKLPWESGPAATATSN